MSTYYTNPTQISPHFNSSEFICKCGCKKSLIDDSGNIADEKVYLFDY